MTQHQLSSLEADCVVSRARSVAGSVAVNTAYYATPANYASISSIDTRLNTISSTIYPQSVLDKMTPNDKVYALRLNDDPTTI